VKKFNVEHIRIISFLENIGISVKDVFIGDYFIAILTEKEIKSELRKILSKTFKKKIFNYVYTEDIKDFIRQFSKDVEFDGEVVKISIPKKIFLAMVWFLKRNYGRTFKFIFLERGTQKECQ